MYKKEIVASLLQVAENVVMVEDRFYYAPFLFILEEYCVKNGLVVGGSNGIKMTLEKMLENGLGVGDFYYKLFADDHVYEHAKNIANNMYNKGAEVYRLIGVDEKNGGFWNVDAINTSDGPSAGFWNVDVMNTSDEHSAGFQNSKDAGNTVEPKTGPDYQITDFNLIPLHQITEKQAKELAVYGSDKNIYSHLGSGYPWDLSRIKILMKNSAEDSAANNKIKQTYFHWLIESKGKTLGYIGLHPISQNLLQNFEKTNDVVLSAAGSTFLQIRVFIGKEHQGNGYASQAIKLLCRSKNFLMPCNIVIWAVNDASNKAACGSSKKAGLTLIEKSVKIQSYSKTAKYNIYACLPKENDFHQTQYGGSKQHKSNETANSNDKNDENSEQKDYSAQMLTNQTLSAKLVRFMEMLKYIYVDTNIKNKLVTIYVNMRPIAEIHKIGKYRDINLIDLIGPILADTLFYYNKNGPVGSNVVKERGSLKEHKILCMSYEIQLIELYKFLYNTYPAMERRSYAELYKTVQIVIEKIKPTFEAKAIGSSEPPAPKHADKSHQNAIFQIIKENPHKFVVIGDHSILHLSKFDVKLPRIDSPRLQLLTDTEQLETICDRITNLLQRGSESAKQPTYKAIMSKFDLKVPNDKFLEKYTIYIVESESKRTPIADLYNSLDYDVVPYYEDSETKIRYSGIYATLRFKLIDIYASKLILSLGTTNEDFIKAKIIATVSQIFELNNIATLLITKDPFLVFQKENHAGCYIAENVLRKKLIKDQERLRKYFPYNKKEM